MTQKIREIAFDTETTGLSAKNGDRIIELGCVEMIDKIATGKTFHRYINPHVSLSEKITEITGLTDADLVDKPPFEDPNIVDAFLEFVADSNLVAHNAQFDRAFINEELKRAGRKEIAADRFVDTLVLARKKFPGASNSLDALCKRFDISLETREKHGALIDSELLAEVYLELSGGRVRSLDFDPVDPVAMRVDLDQSEQSDRTSQRLAVPNGLLNKKEEKLHKEFVDTFPVSALWNKYIQ